ncbi:unnamed protein product [Musa acuminata subsp. burmannicoides]
MGASGSLRPALPATGPVSIAQLFQQNMTRASSEFVCSASPTPKSTIIRRCAANLRPTSFPVESNKGAAVPRLGQFGRQVVPKRSAGGTTTASHLDKHGRGAFMVTMTTKKV